MAPTETNYFGCDEATWTPHSDAVSFGNCVVFAASAAGANLAAGVTSAGVVFDVGTKGRLDIGATHEGDALSGEEMLAATLFGGLVVFWSRAAAAASGAADHVSVSFVHTGWGLDPASWAGYDTVASLDAPGWTAGVPCEMRLAWDPAAGELELEFDVDGTASAHVLPLDPAWGFGGVSFGTAGLGGVTTFAPVAYAGALPRPTASPTSTFAPTTASPTTSVPTDAPTLRPTTPGPTPRPTPWPTPVPGNPTAPPSTSAPSRAPTPTPCDAVRAAGLLEPEPALASATFSATGAEVDVVFDAPTDRAGAATGAPFPGPATRL